MDKRKEQKKQRFGHVNFFESKKPQFLLQRTISADVAVKKYQVNTAKTYKGALLSAGSDMGKGKKGAGLTDDRLFYSTQSGGDGCYITLAKDGQPKGISEDMKQDRGRGVMIEGTRQGVDSHISVSGTANSYPSSYVGPRLRKESYPKSNVRNSGQAHVTLDYYRGSEGLEMAQARTVSWASGRKSDQAQENVQGLTDKIRADTCYGRGPVYNSRWDGPRPVNSLRWKIKQRILSDRVFTGPESRVNDHAQDKYRNGCIKTNCNFSGQIGVSHNQLQENTDSGYISDFEIRINKKQVRRAASVPAKSKQTKDSRSKILKGVNPKLKDHFCLGKIIKWNDFSGQEFPEKQVNSNLSVHESGEEFVDVQKKSSIFKVYTRNYTRNKRGEKMSTQKSNLLQKDEDAVMGISEGSEGGAEIKGFSSSDDDNSSEDFNITSDIDVEVEKEIQEEAAFEGVRCLLGEERQVLEGVTETEEVQVLNQSNHNESSLYQSSGKNGKFLSALNIRLIKADRKSQCDNHDAGPLSTNKKGVRELQNLVCSVNYEKGWRGKGKISHQ